MIIPLRKKAIIGSHKQSVKWKIPNKENTKMNYLSILFTAVAFVFTLALSPALAQDGVPDVPAPPIDQPVKQVDCDDDDRDDKDRDDCDDDDKS